MVRAWGDSRHRVLDASTSPGEISMATQLVHPPITSVV
ncbi:hypothetical protein SynRS9902_00670 [Synechococcus sp. RS9902]|nr:hypothetical protein SynRS9902_00670 [Synechococcus sp. RS9902]